MRSHLTLASCTVLHAFTHAYGTMLVPLYLLMRQDLNLSGVGAASLIVTVYGFTYCLSSFGAGILADYVDRKRMLAINLIGNAVVITAMGLTHSYPMLLGLAFLGGLFGALFHPAAGALVTAHYPKNPGMPIGVLGIGAGFGFFFGPHYAGWRAETATWQWMNVSAWQRPCIEMGLMGIAVALIFILVAREVPHTAQVRRMQAPLSNRLRRRAAAVAALFACRDFAGIATLTLASIYLQKARGLDTKQAGFILGAMTLISMLVNPLAVWISAGKRRLYMLAAAPLLGGIVLATVPHWPVSYVLAVLCVFQAFHLGSYALAEAATLERVPAVMRGRMVGLFITIAGTLASPAPWVMGWWTDQLQMRARDPSAYAIPFAVIGAIMAVASLSAPLIARLGEAAKEPAVQPISEITPQTVHAVG